MKNNTHKITIYSPLPHSSLYHLWGHKQFIFYLFLHAEPRRDNELQLNLTLILKLYLKFRHQVKIKLSPNVVTLKWLVWVMHIFASLSNIGTDKSELCFMDMYSKPELETSFKSLGFDQNFEA